MTNVEAPAEGVRRAWALEQSGEWEAAGREYSAAFRRAAGTGEAEAMADAVRGGARVRRLQGRLDEAEEMALLSECLATLHALPRAAARATNVRAMIRFTRNDLDGARSLYEAALKTARQVHDDELVGLVALNLGVIANIRGELGEARVLYLESVAATLRSRDKHAALMAYNNLGLLCSDLREWLEAELYFDRGLEIAERRDDRPMLAKLHVNRAEPLIHMGEMARARETLARAEEVAAALGDPATLAIAGRYHAVMARLEGDLAGAERHLGDALALAHESGSALERAEALGGLAHLRWTQGRHAEARAALLEAREGFRALGAQRELRRLDAVLAAWDAVE